MSDGQMMIIEVRVNEWTMRDVNPHVPFTPAEIATQAKECQDSGASIVHFHARDMRTGDPSADPTLYAEAVRRIREKTDLIIMPTNLPPNLTVTTFPPSLSALDRIAPILDIAGDPETRPELAPIDMVTCNLDRWDEVNRVFRSRDRTYINTREDWRLFAKSYRAAGIKPVPFLWNIGSVRGLEKFILMRILEEAIWCELVLMDGLIDGHPGSVEGLKAFLDFFPPDAQWKWTVLANGCDLFKVAPQAIELGGHISIGLGDYHYQNRGLPTNAELVRDVAQLASAAGRKIADPMQARDVLGLPRPRRK